MPKKGIATTISIIIFLLITIAMVGSAYIFVTNIATGQTSTILTLKQTGQDINTGNFYFRIQNVGRDSLEVSGLKQIPIPPVQNSDYQPGITFAASFDEAKGKMSADLITMDGSNTPLHLPSEDADKLWTKSGASGGSVVLMSGQVIKTDYLEGDVLPDGSYAGGGYTACAYFLFPYFPEDVYNNYYEFFSITDNSGIPYSSLSVNGRGDLLYFFDARDGTSKSMEIPNALTPNKWHFTCINLQTPEICEPGYSYTQTVSVDGFGVGTLTHVCIPGEYNPGFYNGVGLKIEAPVPPMQNFKLYADNPVASIIPYPADILLTRFYCAQVIGGVADLGNLKVDITGYESRAVPEPCAIDDDCPKNDDKCQNGACIEETKPSGLLCSETPLPEINPGDSATLHVIGGCYEGCNVKVISQNRLSFDLR